MKRLAKFMMRLLILSIALHQCLGLAAVTNNLLEKYLSADYLVESISLQKKCISASDGRSQSQECRQVDYFLKLRKNQDDLNREIQITTKGKQFVIETLPEHLAYSNVFEDYIVANRFDFTSCRL